MSDDLVSLIQPGGYLGPQTDPAEEHPSGSVARIDAAVLPGGAGVRFEYEVLHPEHGRVHHESTVLARTSQGLQLVCAHTHGNVVSVLSEAEPGLFVGGPDEPFPMAIRIEVPEAGRLVYSWSYGMPGEELRVRDVGDLRLQ